MSAPAKAATNSRSMFADGFTERRDLEQYFWNQGTVERLMKALEYTGDCCCLTTPTLAHKMHETGREETLLDIDTRFEYLPKYRYWDILKPAPVDAGNGKPFHIIVFDPPFFYISLAQLYTAVLEVCKNDTSTKLMLGFLKREEPALLKTFAAFNLKRTNFVLEYATVKENKWTNYCLFSNVDLPGVKRQTK